MSASRDRVKVFVCWRWIVGDQLEWKRYAETANYPFAEMPRCLGCDVAGVVVDTRAIRRGHGACCVGTEMGVASKYSTLAALSAKSFNLAFTLVIEAVGRLSGPGAGTLPLP